jgi:hypothetical protein
VRSLMKIFNECLVPQRASGAILGDVSIDARSGKLPLQGNVPGNVDALIEQVRRTEGALL